MKPTYEQLEEELASVKKELAKTAELLKIALQKIAVLEERLNKNSKNSSKPPSTDQKGHTQKTLKKIRPPRQGFFRNMYPSERIDHHIMCSLTSCPHCQSNGIKQIEGSFKWQQVDLPEIKAIVTQYDCLKYKCKDCGQSSFGALPKGIPFSSFGPKLISLIAYATGCLHLSKREAKQLINHLYEIEISEGSIVNMEENVAAALQDVYDRIYRFVIHGKLVRHFDETSWRNSGSRCYVWISTTRLAAYYKIDPGRSKETFQKIIDNNTRGASVTDRYNVYNALNGPHQYCFAHLIRDFRKFAERQGEDQVIGTTLEQLFRKACKLYRQKAVGEISNKAFGCSLHHVKKGILDAFFNGIANGSEELAGLCDRLFDQQEHLWAFVTTAGMEPTNNIAERDLRKLVLWRKKSYGTRSRRGQRFVERISTVIESLKKNDQNVFSFLTQAVEAYYKKQQAPLIVAALGF